MPHATRATLLQLLALALIVLLAYWPGLSGSFLFDDFSNIVHKKAVHAESISMESMATAAEAYKGSLSRPIPTISFAIDHAVWGLKPWGFKLTSLLVHLANALLVYALVRRLLPLSDARAPWGSGAAFSIALIWAIHPLQVSTVHYIVQRMEMLSLTFVLLALLAYLAGRLRQARGERGWPWLLASALLVVLGLMCKETALLFPAFTLALELTVLGFRAERPATAKAWRWAYAASTAAAVLVFVFLIIPRYANDAVFAIRDFTAIERVLTQLRVLPMYLWWILVPQPASYVFYHDNFAASQGLLDPVSTLLGGLLLASLGAAALLLRRRMPLFALGILWFFAAHVLTSNVIALELVFEHRNYFALLGVLIAVSELVRRIPVGEIPRIRELTVGALVAGLLVLTVIRSATWGNEVNLALEFASKNPGSSRASLDLGELYMRMAKRDANSRFYAMGVAELERGSRLPNSSPVPEQGLIVYAAKAGQPAKPEWWDRIVHKLQTRAIGPQEVTMLVALLDLRHKGLAIDDGRFADAYLVLVNRMQMPPTQYFAFGEHAIKFLKDEKLANSLFKRAVDRSGGNAELVNMMAEGLVKEGFPDQADVILEHARSLGIAGVGPAEPALPGGPTEPGS
jgi:hypothetical protein